MENWIIRFVASICAASSFALFWILGVFLVIPWQTGRMLALSRAELQMIGVPLLVGFAVLWGAIHLFALPDRERNPGVYATIRATLIIASIAAMIGGIMWTQARIA